MKETSTKYSKDKSAHHAPRYAVHYAISPTIQRKPGSCACGGNCPRCQEKSKAQTKLHVSEPGDMFEREADRIAQMVTSAREHTDTPHAPTPTVPAQGARDIARTRSAAQMSTGHSQPPHLTPRERGRGLFNKNSDVLPPLRSGGGPGWGQTAHQKVSSAAVADTANTDEVVRNLGAGRPLDHASRDHFESHLGHDLGAVRLHTGNAAAQSASELGARAYTTGRNVVFGENEYAPGSASGRHLLAHELVHVVQQGAAAPRALAPAAYSLRIVDDAGNERFLGPPIPDVTRAPTEIAVGEEDESIPVQRMPKQGGASTVFVQRTATFTPPKPQPDDPLIRVLKGMTPGLTSPIINGTKTPTADQLEKALTPTNVKQTGSAGGNVSCQIDGFNLTTSAEQIVSTVAPKGGWVATIKPAAAISGEAKCAKVASIPVTMNAMPDNADLVKRVQQSEDEHVADLKWLHNRYFVPYDAFVNGLRGSGADLNACGADLVKQLGFRFMETGFEFSHGWATSLEKLDGKLGTHTDNAKITTNPTCSAATIDVGAPKPTKKGAAAGNVAAVAPTVTAFSPTTLKVVGKELKDGKTVVKKFTNVADATTALGVIQHYGMTSRNQIGPFEYWLVGKGAPSGVLKGANEVPINALDHQVTFDFPNAGEWTIIQMDSTAKGLNINLIASFGAKRDEAYSAWNILTAFNFTQKAWVGGTRAAPEMMYFRT